MEPTSEFVCIICLDALFSEKPVVRIECNCQQPANMFHESCISAWIRHTRNLRRLDGIPHPKGFCPTCKFDVVGGSKIIRQYERTSGINGVIDLTRTEVCRCYFISLSDDN